MSPSLELCSAACSHQGYRFATTQGDDLTLLSEGATRKVMGARCCDSVDSTQQLDQNYRRILTAALAKGLTMGVFGLWVLSSAAWQGADGTLPHAGTMRIVGAAALAANLGVFGLLWSYRSGDSNTHSVWLCLRNDVAAKGAVFLASAGVFGTGKGWPDAVVAFIIAFLALQGATRVIRLATRELDQEPVARAHRTKPIETPTR